MSKKAAKTIYSLQARTKILGVLAVLLLAGGGNAIVQADSFDVKIKALEAQNNRTQDNLDALSAQANSYQDAIQALSNRIAAVQRSIAVNQAKQAELQKQILIKRKEIAQQRVVLGDVLRSMYVDGQMSTIEILATSDTLSDYVDKEEYRNSVQGKVQEALATIAELQKQLQAQKVRVDKLIADQRSQQAQLSADKQRQASLLAYNQQQQSNYSAQLKKNNTRIAQLEAEQAAAQAAYARANGVNYYGTAGNGGYPSIWANVPINSRIDNWGMYNRQCVSYVAWKVAQVHGYMPHWGGNYTKYYGGNAKAWDDNARIDRITVSGEPRRHSVAVWNENDGVGSFGHVAFVEVVNGDGSIEVSQYNFFTQSLGKGKFSRMHLSASAASRLDYIYF